ncbi:hypothetical protein, partial [Candidatus Sororendozoicomonas aggregata]|uniref:hypothetical protein n=1 Tax=Candidatus Sororendozoicomonas aggregata TaxID=3073239 RepID=UPI002ED071B8
MHFKNNKSCDNNNHPSRLACTIAAIIACYTAPGQASSTTVSKYGLTVNQRQMCERSEAPEEKAALCLAKSQPLSDFSGQSSSSYYFDGPYPVFSLAGLEAFYYYLLSNKYISMAAAVAGAAAGAVAIPKDNKKEPDNSTPLDSEPDDTGSDNSGGVDSGGSDGGGN